MNYLKEFDGLPKELYDWGQEAISRIQSPEKKHRVAAELRTHIDLVWDERLDLPEKHRIQWILEQLGDAQMVAEQLMLEEKYDPNGKKKDMIGAIAFLLVGALVCIYPMCVYLGKYGTLNGILSKSGQHWNQMYFTVWKTGQYAGMGLAAGIFLMIIGVCLLISSCRKKHKKMIHVNSSFFTYRSEQEALQEFERENAYRSEIRAGKKLNGADWGPRIMGAGAFICVGVPIVFSQVDQMNKMLLGGCFIAGGICIGIGAFLWKVWK